MLQRHGRRGSRRARLCRALAAAALIAAALPGAASADTPYALGLAGPEMQAGTTSLDAAVTAPASVPATVDLSSFAPTPGNQGGVNSCAAWAVDYTALGYWENKQGIAGGTLAPMYTYSQLVRGVNTGTYIDDHLHIAGTQGVDTRADYTQGDYNYTNLPTTSETLNAVKWQLSSYTDLPIRQDATSTVTQQSIENALAAGSPVVLGIPVWNNFFSVSSADHGYYSAIGGSFAGYHAVTALGYDANGVRVENQWGTGWGDGGWATLSWSFVNQYVFQAVSVGQLVVAGPPPTATTAPSVSGSAAPGEMLTGTQGTWTGNPGNLTLQWQRDTGSGYANIIDAHGTGYVIQSGDVGASIRLRVTGTNGGGSAASYSNVVGPVSGGAAPSASVAPAVTGSATQGSVLSGTGGTWTGSGNVYTWQWQRDTGSGYANILDAHGTTYTLTSADVGAHVRLRVTAVNSGGLVPAFSNVVGPVAAGGAGPANTVAPAISGTASVGAVLSSTAGAWTGSGNVYTYQWQRDSGSGYVNILDTHGTTYTLTQADAGAHVRLRITAVNSGGLVPAFSNAVGPVAAAGAAPANTVAPTISGTASVGSVLSSTAGTWTGLGNVYTYQWQRDSGSGYVNILDTHATTYTLTQADVGAHVRLRITAVNPGGLVPAFSNATAVVQ